MTLICTHCGEPIQPGDESNPGRGGRPTAHADHTICFTNLHRRAETAEAERDDFIIEAVEQNCGVPNSHGIRIFSHSFMATYEGWIEFLVQRGKMRRLDEDRELYVFVAEMPPAEEAPAP